MEIVTIFLKALKGQERTSTCFCPAPPLAPQLLLLVFCEQNLSLVTVGVRMKEEVKTWVREVVLKVWVGTPLGGSQTQVKGFSSGRDIWHWAFLRVSLIEHKELF